MAPNFKSFSEGGMLDGLKSRLGFGDSDSSSSRASHASRSSHRDEYDDYDDEFGDYSEEFAEYGPDYDDGSSRTYEPLSEVSTRPAGSRRSSSPYSSYGSFRGNNLVTIDDVKTTTRSSERGASGSTSSRTSETSRSSYASASATAPISRSSAPKYVDDASAASVSASRRSDGLDSLFSSTASDSAASTHEGAKASYDPYEAYESKTPSSHTPARSISVLKPVSYGDVERIAKILKSGDVVVIALKNTPDDLSKRILDFAFGVSSALDAVVECPGEKVFAITRGNALSSVEKQALKNQGVL